MEEDFSIFKKRYQQPQIGSFPNVKLMLMGALPELPITSNEDLIQWKTISNINNRQIRSFSNLKIKLRGTKQNQKLLEIKPKEEYLKEKRTSKYESRISQPKFFE